MTGAPDDYEETTADVQSDFGDYERAQRLPQPRGKLHLCHNCYKTGLGFTDTCCPSCLATLKHLAILRVEIGQKVPAALTMSLPELFRHLWNGYQKLKKAS